MTLNDIATYIGSWFKHDETRFDQLRSILAAGFNQTNDDLVLIANEFVSLTKEVQKMSAQTDALAAEVDKVVSVLQSGDALLKASADAEAQLQSHLAGDALDTAAVQAATDKLAAARAAFEGDVAKLSAAATTPPAPETPATEGTTTEGTASETTANP